MGITVISFLLTKSFSDEWIISESKQQIEQ